jgi:N6-adenosine-specific RNA methylase IME4
MYKTILADPPWKLCTGGAKSLAVHTHYPVQTKDEVIRTMKAWLNQHPIAPEAHLYLWTINSYSAGNSRGILDAVDVCKAIGFRPITNLVWVKPRSNPTPYGQRGTELCLFGARWRKGKHREVMYKGTTNPECVSASTLTKSIDWFEANRREHSRKPDSFYDLIEQRSNGPYLEMYSRTNRAGWTSVGNQTGTWSV